MQCDKIIVNNYIHDGINRHQSDESYYEKSLSISS